jgi:AcrR family transcriptional regulator
VAVDRIDDSGPTQPLVLQLRARRSQMMVLELESVALRLFEQRGFSEVTVDDLASAAGISPRTFYRYFPAKDDVFQVRLATRSEALRDALAARPADEAPLPALRCAITDVLAAEDTARLRQWIGVVAATPAVLRSVLGGLVLNMHTVVAGFVGDRLSVPSRALVPTTLAAAVTGVVDATQTHWYFEGGDLAAMVSESLQVLERGPDSSLTERSGS